MKIGKFVTGSAAALAIIGAAAAGTAFIAAPSELASVRLAAVGVPAPQDPPAPAPGADVPAADQLTSLLTSLADPNVPFAKKSNLVEGGIGGSEAHIADRELKKAAKNGDLPLAFNVTNAQPGGPGSATADVAISGPKLPNPVTRSVTFVNQGSWMLSRASAMELLQAAGH